MLWWPGRKQGDKGQEFCPLEIRTLTTKPERMTPSPPPRKADGQGVSRETEAVGQGALRATDKIPPVTCRGYGEGTAEEVSQAPPAVVSTGARLGWQGRVPGAELCPPEETPRLEALIGFQQMPYLEQGPGRPSRVRQAWSSLI